MAFTRLCCIKACVLNWSLKISGCAVLNVKIAYAIKK